MAQRRMFNRAIIESDLFLEMPLTTQALYFHLGMRADDEGFIDNPKKILREVNCGEDDLKLLITKGFVLCFNNGILVVTHWRIHNTLQKDRFKPSIHSDERALLTLKNNREYVFINNDNKLDTECIQGVSTSETQYSINETNIEIVSTSVDGRNAFDCQSVVNSFNSICVSLPKVQKLTDKRRKQIKSAKTLLGEMSFEEFFRIVESSDFLSGRSGKWNGCGFDWVIQPANLTKVIEGNYQNQPTNADDKAERYRGYENWS